MKKIAMRKTQKFAAILSAALAKTGWSKAELSRRCGINRRDAISSYTLGTSMPSAESMEKIAEALGGSVDDLMKGRLPAALPAADLPAADLPAADLPPVVATPFTAAPVPVVVPKRGRPRLERVLESVGVQLAATAAKPATETVELHQGADGRLHLRLDRVVTLDQAQRILAVLATAQ